MLLAQLRAAESSAAAAAPSSGGGSSSRGVVISTYPPGYEGCGPAAVVPHGGGGGGTCPCLLLCATHFDDDGMLRLTGRSMRRQPMAGVAANALQSTSEASNELAVSSELNEAPPNAGAAAVRDGGVGGGSVVPSMFWAAGFSFSRAEMMQEVMNSPKA